MSNLNEIVDVLLYTGATTLALGIFSDLLPFATVGELGSARLKVLSDDSQMGIYIRTELCKEIRKRILKANFLLKISYDPEEDTYQAYVRSSTADLLSFSVDNPVAYLSKDNLSSEDLAKLYNLFEQDCKICISRREGSYDITLEMIESEVDSFIINSDRWNLLIPFEKVYDVTITELIDMITSLGETV